MIGFSRTAEQFAAENGAMYRHWTNHWVIDGDGDSAAARCHAMIVDRGSVLGSGIYHDRLRKVDGSWSSWSEL